jgi:hypothetical protein
MRTVIVVITAALALASSGAAAPISEGYRFPLAFFEPRQDPTARGDVYWSIGFATNAASACWQFGVFTRERTTHIYLRRAPAGRHGPIVDTFNMRPPSPEPRWSGSTGFSGCRALPRRVARAMVRAPRTFYLEARTVTLRRAARFQLRGPAKRCSSLSLCG